MKALTHMGRNSAVMTAGVVACLTGCLALGAHSMAQTSPQGATFRTNTDVVSIDVSVRRMNASVRGLTAADFELSDNGVVQVIDSQSLDSVPIDVTLVVGASLARDMGTRIGPEVSRFVDWLHPDDRLRLLSYSAGVEEVVPMGSPEAWPRAGVTERIWQREEGIDPRHDPRLRGRALFDALLIALATPSELGRRRLVIPYCFQGESGSRLADGQVIEAVAARSDALLHVAMLSGRTPGSPYDSTPTQYVRRTLTAAAEATGGTLTDVNQGVGAFKAILDQFRERYVLRYTATNVSPIGWHEVSVRVPARPDYVVQARKRYLGR